MELALLVGRAARRPHARPDRRLARDEPRLPLVRDPAPARAALAVMDRLNPTIIEEPGYEWVAAFLAEQRVEVVASLPCHSEANVDEQRGDGVFAASIRALQRAERARLRPSGERPRAEPRLQPERRVPAARAAPARRRLQAPSRRALRHRLRPSLHDHQHADQALRLMAALEGCVRRLHGRAARVAPSRERRPA